MPRTFVERFHTYGVDQPETDRDGNLTEGIQSLFLRRGNSPCGILYLGVGGLNYHGSSRYRNARPVLKAPEYGEASPLALPLLRWALFLRCRRGLGRACHREFPDRWRLERVGGQPRKAAMNGTAPPFLPAALQDRGASSRFGQWPRMARFILAQPHPGADRKIVERATSGPRPATLRGHPR